MEMNMFKNNKKLITIERNGGFLNFVKFLLYNFKAKLLHSNLHTTRAVK